MGLDPVIVEHRLVSILREIEFLKQNTTQSKVDFLDDEKSIKSIAKTIETITQFIIDIASHIIAQNKWGVPDSYKHAIITLEKNKVIEDSLSSNLQDLIAMRNIMVHRYLDVDYEIIWESVNRVISDAQTFVSVIKNFIKSIHKKNEES